MISPVVRSQPAKGSTNAEESLTDIHVWTAIQATVQIFDRLKAFHMLHRSVTSIGQLSALVINKLRGP
jgi:hypothetical protein